MIIYPISTMRSVRRELLDILSSNDDSARANARNILHLLDLTDTALPGDSEETIAEIETEVGVM